MFCFNCGKKLEDNVKECPYCHTVFESQDDDVKEEKINLQKNTEENIETKEAASAVEEPVYAAEESAPAVEEPVYAAEKEASSPAMEEPVSDAEKMSAMEESGPVTDEAAVAAEEPAASANASDFAAEELSHITEESAAAAKTADFAVEESAPASDGKVEASIFCYKCGTKNDASNMFCENCGARIGDETPENVPVKPVNTFKPRRGILALIPIGILVLLIIGFGVGKLGSMLTSKKEMLVYVKDGDLFKLGARNKPVEMADNYFENGEFEYSNRGPVMSHDGKYIFYPRNIDSSGRFELYYSKINSKDGEKIASDVEDFHLLKNGNLIYLKDYTVYMSDLKDNKTKLISDVSSIGVLSKDEKKLLINNTEYKYYIVEISKEPEKNKIDSGMIEIIKYDENFNSIVYSKTDARSNTDVYLYSSGEKTKIASNVLNHNMAAFEKDGNLWIYYVKDSGKKYSGLDLLTDDYPDDRNITKPDRSDYVTEKQVQSFWGTSTYEEVSPEYEKKYKEYEEKLERDRIREQYAEDKFESQNLYVYSTKDKSEKEVISDCASDAGDFLGLDHMYYWPQAFSKNGNPTGIFSTILMEDAKGIVKLSEIYKDDSSDIESLALKHYIFAGDKITEIKDDIEINNIGNLERHGNNGNEDYFYLSKDNTELYRLSIKDGSAELLEDSKFGGFLNGSMYYFRDYSYDREYGELVVDDKAVDDEVSIYGVFEEDGRLFYRKDFSYSGSKDYSLYMLKNGKGVKISEDVSDFAGINGDVAVLYDYSFERGYGTLGIFDGKKLKEVEDEVSHFWCIGRDK